MFRTCCDPGTLLSCARFSMIPTASANDRFVALELLTNANISAGRVLPSCQDTGTAIVVAHKGENVYTGFDDAEAISRGIYDTFEQKNLRFSQMAPLDMYTEKNTGEQSARADRYLQQSPAMRVRVALHRKGGRVCQQVFPVPGDQGAAESGVAAALRGREDSHARNVRVSALSPRVGDRRDIRGVHAEDRQSWRAPIIWIIFRIPATSRAARFATSRWRRRSSGSATRPGSAPSSAASTSPTTCA